jgi:N-methylhydantoinase A
LAELSSGGRRATVQVGIDIGGTFTDLVALDSGGRSFNLKTPTVRADPVQGVVRGLELLTAQDVEGPDIEYVVHGTTLAINTVIQRSGATVALLVTEGFRDVLELGRLRLPQPWSFYSARPGPLVPRERVLAVPERVRADGTVERALGDQDVAELIERLSDIRPDCVAICLLHAHRYPEHEVTLEAALRQALPTVLVSRSSSVWPQAREYERALVTVINAYVQPAMTSYLGRLQDALQRSGVRARPYITRSDGGIMTAEAAAGRVVRTLLSGPAAGVVGARQVADHASARDVITLDVGGTSADVAVIRGGEPVTAHEQRVGDFTVSVPAVGISTIGAGGGSVAWLDLAGVLRVGPRSVGSDPGPACYARGGNEATLTDAFLVAGYLRTDNFPGIQALNKPLAERALDAFGPTLGLDTQGVAAAVIRVALASMYAEISSLMERQGLDRRSFTLLALGGAGPVVATQLADELGIARVLVPRWPGTLCAWGALHADVSSDFICAVGTPLAELPSGRARHLADELRLQGEAWLATEAPPAAARELKWSGDLRYRGQSYELEVPLELDWLVGPGTADIEKAFHEAHERVFSHHDPQATVELVALRLRAIGVAVWPGRAPDDQGPEPSPVRSGPWPAPARRPIVVEGLAHEAWVYERNQMGPGHKLQGPAVVDQEDSTVVVAPGWAGVTDGHGALHLHRGGGR